MPTYDKMINIYFNRLLDQTSLRENLLEFFDDKLSETVSAMFQGQSGTLDSQKVELTSTANDTFDLDMTNARKVVVGNGNVITLPENANRVLKEHLQVPFVNTTAQTYEVGIRYQQVEDGIQINGRTGAPEYPRLREDMGEKDNPDSVVDTPGVSITLYINGLTQSSVDHSGRKAIVFLTIPQSGVESVAYYEGVVAYSSPNNQIVIPYSGGDGPLGQDTSVDPPSTLATDYIVFLPGASWKQGTSTIYGDNDYAFIGRIAGNGPGATPTSFSEDLQNPVFLITLQNAYDGIGSGAGREIVANDGAVNISSLDSNDNYRSLLVLDRLGATEGSAGGVTIVSDAEGHAQLNIVPIENTAGSPHLQIGEPGTTGAAGLVNLTRTGRDLVSAGVSNLCDFAFTKDFLTAANNGLYRIASFDATSVTLQNLDGTAISSWASGETGTVYIMRTRFSVGESAALDGMDGASGGARFNGLAEDTEPVIRTYPHGATANVEHYDRSTPPRLQALVTRDGTYRLQTTGTPGNARNALLELLRAENTEYMQFMLLCIEGDLSSIPITSFKPYDRGTTINPSMSATLSGSVITLTDGGINLLDTNIRLSQYAMIVELFDSADEADDGFYKITSFTGTTITTTPLDGGSATFSGASATCRVLLPTIMVGGSIKFATSPSLFDGSVVMTFRDVSGDQTQPIIILPEAYASGDIFRLYNSRDPSVGSPQIASAIQMQQDSTDWKDQHPKFVHGGDDSGDPIVCGHEFNLHAGYDADDFSMNIKPHAPRQASGESFYNRARGEFNHEGVELRRLEQCGRIAKNHEFYDDFFRSSSGSYWTESVSSGTVHWADGGASGGIMRLAASAGIGNYARVYVPNTIYMRHGTLTPYRIAWLAGRFKPGIAAGESPNHLNQLVKVYFDCGSGYQVGAQYEASGTETQFEFFATDGVSTNTTTGKGVPGSDDDESGWFKFWMRLDLEANSISVSWDHEATSNSNGIDALNFPSPTNSQWRGDMDLYCECQNINDGTYPHAGYFDWVHIWDEVVQSGGKDRNS